jgi:hypothetical protein
MGLPFENFWETDIKFTTYIADTVGDITNLNAPFKNHIEAKAKSKTFGPAGYEMRHYQGHSVNIKMGRPYMDYPNRSKFQMGLYKQVPTTIALTYAIDQGTMDAYRSAGAGTVNNEKGAIVRMEEELKILGKGLGHRLDFYLATSDASGKLATATGSPTTTNVPLTTAWNGVPANGVGASQLYPEVDYDVVRPATHAVITSFNVPFTEKFRINKTTHVLDFTGAPLSAAPAAGDIIVPKGSAYNGIYGFPKLFDGGKSGLWQGKIVTNSLEDQTMVVDAQTIAINNGLIERGIGKRKIRNMTTEVQPFELITSTAQEIEYISSGWAIFQINNGGGGTLDTSIEKARYRQKDLTAFPNIDADSLFGVDISDICALKQFGPGVISPDGLVWRQAQAAAPAQFGKGVWYTIYGVILNFMIENPQDHFRLKNLFVNPNYPTLATYSTTS